MKASEFKALSAMLGVFASSRENADTPASRIGVQASKGVAKLIAGNKHAGVIVTLDHAPQDNFTYAIEARPFLQAAKAISGKQEVTVVVDPTGLTIATSEGGKVFLKAKDELREVGFAAKPKSFEVTTYVGKGKFGQITKMLGAVHGDREIEAPTLEAVDNVTYIVGVSDGKRPMYCALACRSEGQNGYHAAAYPAFWDALKVIEGDGVILFGDEGTLARTEGVEVYCSPYKVAKYIPETRTSEAPRYPDPWPIMSIGGEPSVSFKMLKKELIEAIKGVMPNDEHGRVTLAVEEGAVNVSAFGNADGMKLPAETAHEGHRSVNSEYLLKMLRAMDGKYVKIGWSQQPALILSNEEMEGWTILLGPVALS